MADCAIANPPYEVFHQFGGGSLVVPGLVPGIHVLAELRQERRGWPGRSPAMTKKTKTCWSIDDQQELR